MDIKFITRGLDLSEDEFQESLEMLVKLRALSATERAQFATALGAQKVIAEKASKKSSRSSSSKSPRATGIERQLSKRREQGRVGMTAGDDDADNDDLCEFEQPSGRICGLQPDHNVHHLQNTGGFHPFVSVAPTAPARSPANGASSATERSTRRTASSSTPESDDGESGSASLSGANSEASAVSAGAVTGGSSE